MPGHRRRYGRRSRYHATCAGRRPAVRAGRRPAVHAGPGQQRAGRLVVRAVGGDPDQFPLRIAKCGQPAAEHAAGIDADRVVDPGGLGHRGMAVDHDRLAPVVLRPRVADRQPELVGLPGGLPVQRERPDRRRRTPLHLLAQAGVGDHQPAAIQHIVADQAVKERNHAGAELFRFRR